MKVLSLFDGISCARVALERAGIQVDQYIASEIDKYAIQISEKNYPDILHVGDVLGVHDWISDSIEIDLMIGGSPCQDLSVAKKNRKGLDGERSGLFWEYVRILKKVKPKYFILENVNSMPKEAKQIITDTLGVEPIMINAALVSAQNRKRLFWTNIANVSQPEDKGILLKDILEPRVSEGFFVKNKSNTIRTSGRGSGIHDKHNWDAIKVCNINPSGNGMNGCVYHASGKSPTLTTNKGEGSKILITPEAGRIIGRKLDENGVRKDYSDIKSVQRLELNEDPNKTNTLSTVQKDNIVVEEDVIRKLTPIECERLQGLPDNYSDGISNSQRYKCLGNAFNVDVVAHILSHL